MKNIQQLFICLALLLAVSLACAVPSPNQTQLPDKSGSVPTGSASARRNVASMLQSEFDGNNEVSIHTKGSNDEILYISFTGLSDKDKAKADKVVAQFRSKISGYGFKRIEFSNGRKTISTYDLNE